MTERTIKRRKTIKVPCWKTATSCFLPRAYLYMYFISLNLPYLALQEDSKFVSLRDTYSGAMF